MIFFSLTEIRRLNRYADYLPSDIYNDFKLLAFGIFVTTSIILTCGLTITMIYTETVWILLMFTGLPQAGPLKMLCWIIKKNIENGENITESFYFGGVFVFWP